MKNCLFFKPQPFNLVPMHCPQEIEKVFQEVFHFPEKLLFASVATAVGQNVNIRTMRVYALENGLPLLLTHTHSTKWQEFLKGGHVALCFVSEDKLTQVIVRGSIQINSEPPEKHWDKVRVDVKAIYDPHYPLEAPYQNVSPQAPQKVPVTFGIAKVIPHFWELLDLKAPSYTESRRFQFVLKNNVWLSQRITVG